MNPPKSIKILHLEFELRFVDEVFFDAANVYGFCDKKHLVIAIIKGTRPALTADNVIHECLHGIHFAMGCAEEMSEETVAMQFAGPLCLLLRDNPALVAWLQSLLDPRRVVDLGMDLDDVDTGAYQ